MSTNTSQSLPCKEPCQMRKAQLVSFIIEANDDGYLASIPGIQGAFAEGDTPQEAIFNCIDVLSMILDYRKEQGNPLQFGEIDLTSNNRLTVAIPVGF